MKKINNLMCIFNIIHCIILLSIKPLTYFLMVYKPYLKFLSDYMILAMSFANLVVAIINMIKKNKNVAVTQFFIAIYYILVSIADKKRWYIFGIIIFVQLVIFLIYDKDKSNKKINILNIIHCIICIIAINHYGYIISMRDFVMKLFIFVLSILNIIVSIKNFKKNDKIIAVTQLIIPIYYSFYYISFLKNIYLMIAFLIIASIIVFIFNMKNNYAEQVSKLYYIPIFVLIFINIIAICIPVRMNLINIKNFENNISKFEREITGKKNTAKQQEIIDKNNYEQVYLKAFQVVYKKKKIWIGFAKNDDEIVIVNSKGERIMELCKTGFGFKEDYGVPFLFFTYLSSNPKYEIEIPKQETMFWVK